MRKSLIIVIVLLIIMFALYQFNRTEVVQNPGDLEGVACTMDAKLCPDGSYVGRVGPNCEFAACPTPVVDEHANLIRVTAPVANATVTSPLTVTGEARGNWYFEASFPIYLYDANGKELAVVPAQAIGEWMTTEFVPFSTTLTFSKPTTPTGTLVLKKDNASGLPEHDDQISIPVRF